MSTANCVASVLLGWMFVLACETDRQHAADSARAEGETLPQMHSTHIPDSVSGPVEKVRGYRVFQAGDCTVWRFQDSVGIHYLAEGRATKYTTGLDVSCSVAR